MKSPRLPKGHSQLIVKATLRNRDVNEAVSVTFDIEPSDKALKRYLEWAAQILNEHSNQTSDMLKKPAQ